jgi:hypothetical protein
MDFLISLSAAWAVAVKDTVIKASSKADRVCFMKTPEKDDEN